MASKSKLVNLDAMIKREDFALDDGNLTASFDQVGTISVRDFGQAGFLAPNLRKPDFQRETNHWAPEQVCSLLECYVNGDLIPSVILWRSSTGIFVIDGGHRLSVLKAWVEDDYGDGPVSISFFGHALPTEQVKAAKLTRKLIAESVGSWQHFQSRMTATDQTESEKIRTNTVASRGLAIQWVNGNAEKAERSFFHINTKGTPLDDLEELLLHNRKKPIAIAARAVIRSGMGHKYWSLFQEEKRRKIEEDAVKIHDILFSPEINSPIKTLDLPLGGSTGVRNGMKILMDFIMAANIHNNQSLAISTQDDDTDGSETLNCLKQTVKLAKRITGNDCGSLGLHPAVYFYGPSGQHSSAMFMGFVTLIARKLSNNDDHFFVKFTKVRSRLEDMLIRNKDLISIILQRIISKKRIEKYTEILDLTINQLYRDEPFSEQSLIAHAGLVGKVFVGSDSNAAEKFSDNTKSAAFIRNALKSALKCPICQGYLDPIRSVSYDHVTRVQDGGVGSLDNCDLTHPYCNQSIKN